MILGCVWLAEKRRKGCINIFGKEKCFSYLFSFMGGIPFKGSLLSRAPFDEECKLRDLIQQSIEHNLHTVNLQRA